MDKILVTLATATLIGYIVTWILRPSVAAEGLETTVHMFLQALPWMIVSMFAAGVLAQFFHADVVARWLGRESGFGGILLGALFGMCGTGSRWAMYPLAAGLIAAEASPGAVFSFVTSWQLVSLTRLPAEIPFYGEQFTLIRAIISVVVAVGGGVLVERVMR